MKTGTKSLLFGVHNIIWHPFTVFLAWHKLYGFPNIKTFICIIIHDWGYWGCPNIDGKEGRKHPEWAAAFVYNKFKWSSDYYLLCLHHSRYLAKMHSDKPSQLCWADKLSICYDPSWFYLLRAKISGELKEYRSENELNGFFPLSGSNKEWFCKIREFMREMAKNQESNTTYM